MLEVTVRTKGISEYKQFLAQASGQIPFINQQTVNATAKDIKKAERDEMRRVFHQPTPFVMRGLRIIYASKKRSRIEAKVWFKDVFGKTGDALERTLLPHIEGGPRQPKSSELMLRRAGIIGADEYIVPSRTAPLNRYGNIPGSTMQKILSDLGSHTAAGYESLTKLGKRQYVFGQVRGVKGIWRVGGGAANAEGGRWSLVFLVVRGAPRYSRRFRFYEVGNRIADRVYVRNWDVAFAKAMRTAR